MTKANRSMKCFWGPMKASALLVGVLSLVVSGCKEKEEASAEKPASTAAQAREQQANDSSTDLVSVSAEGTQFDSPVPAAKIPDGAWMCDMNGQVHYASKTPGDGKCPVCSMKLVKKGAEHQMEQGEHMEHGEHMDNQGHKMAE